MFADFDVDPDGRVFARRVSFDGYGCCSLAEVGRMSEDDSEAILAMVDAGELADGGAILRAYFRANRAVIWSEALEEHGLL